MGEFLAMGGYGDFVWPAYGVSAAALIGLTIHILRRHARLRAALKKEAASPDAKNEHRK